MRRPALLIVAAVLLVAGLWGMREAQRPHPQFAPQLQQTTPVTPPPAQANRHDGLPPFLTDEARATVALIQRGGPFPHRQDGAVFGNREGRLPDRPRGYYHEYTVETPGAHDRGARRIVTGGTPPDVWYYSEDHYDSFRSFSVPAAGAAR
jgi:ribonuclease T1